MTALALPGWRPTTPVPVIGVSTPAAPPAPVTMCRLAAAYRDLDRTPPDLDFAGGLTCPVCYLGLRPGLSGWGCGGCGIGWDWRGFRGVWQPTRTR